MEAEKPKKRTPQSFDCIQDFLIDRGYKYIPDSENYQAMNLPSISAEQIRHCRTPQRMDEYISQRLVQILAA